MLVRFSNEVLSKGAVAVLPQNLSEEWLKKIQKLCDDFLDENFAIDECKEPGQMGDPMLSACVHEILHYLKKDISKMSPVQLAESVTIYALSITMETISRQTDIGLVAPTVDTILSIERIAGYRKKNPAFIRMLEKSCIVDEKETGWFHDVKRKIFSALLGG